MGGWAGLWDGKPIKLDCDHHCTAINLINSLSNKKKTSKLEKSQKFCRQRVLYYEEDCDYKEDSDSIFLIGNVLIF